MAKTTAWVLGVIFVVAGVWGFFGAPIFFMASDVTSNIIHIVAGVVLLALAGKASVELALKVIGIVYVIFAVAGFVQQTTVLGLFATDAATNWVYLVLGLVGAVIGFVSRKSTETPGAPAAPQM